MVLYPSAIIKPHSSGSSSYLDGVLASTCFDVDATIAASYGGSGQTWANLIASPADGAAQTAYDFYLGANGTATTDDPTFTGTAGNAAAYFSLDGGDYFKLKGANPTLLNNLHKTTSGNAWWLAFAFQTGPSITQDTFFATADASFDHGIEMRIEGSPRKLVLRQFNGTSTAAFTPTSEVSAASTDYLVIFSYDKDTNTIRFWNRSTTKESATLTLNTDTSSADSAAVYATNTALADSLASGYRMYGLYGGNAFIDNTEAAAIFAHLEARHARDYTP